jgi:hypothetical protein
MGCLCGCVCITTAARWRGTENGVDDFDPKGSDWERCYQTLYGDGYRRFATVAFRGGELLTIKIDSGGLIMVFRLGNGLALVEPAYSSVEDDESAYDGLLRIPDFVGCVSSPIDSDATEVGVITVGSGAVALLPAPLPGEEIPAALAKLEPDGTAQFPHGPSAESGLVVGLPAGRYRVHLEGAVERSWGRAGRAVIEPYEVARGPRD